MIYIAEIEIKGPD